MLKQEVIIIGYAFQQKYIVFCRTITNREMLMSYIGVTVEVTGASYSLGGSEPRSEPTYSRTKGAIFPANNTSSLIQRAHAQTNV